MKKQPKSNNKDYKEKIARKTKKEKNNLSVEHEGFRKNYIKPTKSSTLLKRSETGSPEGSSRELNDGPKAYGKYSPGNKKQRPRIKTSRSNQKQGSLNSTAPDGSIRLNRYIATSGICSRRQADQLITEGHITVNGKPVNELGVKVLPGDTVKYNGQTIRAERKIYILLNKPKDYITTAKDMQGRKTVYDLIKNACKERVFPVGRLDRNSIGILLLTNDGELASKLSHPKYLKKKIYHVFLDKNLKPSDFEKILSGIELKDGFIKADDLSYVNHEKKNEVGIEIHSGKNRVVRRIFEHLEYKVTKLDRVYFAGLTKKNLPRGKWRFLSQQEINMLKMNAFE